MKTTHLKHRPPEARIDLWQTLRELKASDLLNFIVLILLFGIWEISFVHWKPILWTIVSAGTVLVGIHFF